MYEYLIAYIYEGGKGRTFVQMVKEVSCKEDILLIENTISENEKIKGLAVVNFQLLGFVEEIKDVGV